MTSSEPVVFFRRPWFRRSILGLLLIEVLYVVAFEWAARSGNLAQWVNRRPEKIAISFTSAHSYLPFQVSASGLELHGQTPRQRWRLRADRVGGWLSPLGLFRRTVRFSRADAEGGEFWLRREAAPPAGPEEAALLEVREARMPPIAALPPLAVPRPDPTRPKWSFELPRIAASGFREVWLRQLRLVGEIGARGSFAMYSGRELAVGPSRIEFSGIRAAIGEAEVGRALAGGTDLRIARYPFKEERGRAAFRFISGTADVRGEVAESALLGLYLQRAPWLVFGETPGALTGHLEVESGQVQPGTHAEFVHPDLETSAFDFRATGDARIDFNIQPDESGSGQQEAVLVVKYDDFAVRSGAEEQPQFIGSGLSVVATTPALDLGSILNSTRVKIDLGTARIPDLAAFNSWIPASSGLVLASGDGALSGSLDADLAANDARGEFRAAIDAAKVRYRGLDLAGSVTVEVRIPSADLERRTFDLTGTKVELADFRSPQAEAAGPAVPAAAPDRDAGWWAHLALADGSLTLAPSAGARGHFEVNLRDSVPLVGLFETRKNLPRWVERLLTIEDIRVGGRFAWSPAGMALEDVATKFRRATIRARLHLGPQAKKGVMMIEWHRLALGLQVENQHRNFKLVGVRDWFAKADLGAPMRVEPEDDPLSEAALRQAELGGADLPTADVGYEIVPGSLVRGELDGDPGPEAVAVIALPSSMRSASLVSRHRPGRWPSDPARQLELTPGSEVRSLASRARRCWQRWSLRRRRTCATPTGKEIVRWRPRPTDGRP